MDPCRYRQPKVINNALLQKCIMEQGPQGEAGQLAKYEGIPFEAVQQLRLEFMNILRIDHLWPLKSLTRLYLNNNFIEKIENLDALMELVELDLSFNKIKKIENILNLVNLKKLSLFDNQIELIENMHTLKKLEIFSIGRNYISDMDNIIYLRNFPNLKALNLEENPCTDNKHFINFTLAFLPQLMYYEYKLVKSEDRTKGLHLYAQKLRSIQNEEEEKQLVIDAKEKELADAEFNSKCFVEYLNTTKLFDSLFEDDVDGQAFLKLGEETNDLNIEYKEQFVTCCNKIFEIGQKQYALREKEIKQFLSATDHGKLINQKQSIEIMEEFSLKRNDIFSVVKGIQKLLKEDIIEYETYTQKIEQQAVVFNMAFTVTWRKLMKLELQIYDQIEESNQNFGNLLSEMVNTFLEAAQNIFAQLRSLEQGYVDSIGEEAQKILAQIQAGEIENTEEELTEIMADKDALQNALTNSHDIHMQLIDNREDILISKTKTWFNDFIKSLELNEIQRNRAKILEINHFLDIQKDEFHELINDFSPHIVDPEVTAVLAD